MEAPLFPLPSHSREHWRRLRDEVARVLDEVPLYAGRGAAPDCDDPEAVTAWLAGMPLIGKRDLRRGFPKSLVRRSTDLKAELARGAVEIIATSGTVENRLQVLWEWSWWDPQERAAMRLNARVAQVMAPERGSFREAVLTTPVCGGSTCHVGNLSRAERTIDGMLFLNQAADPSRWTESEVERMIDEWNDFRPDGVEADPAYLAALCGAAQARGARLHNPSYTTLTYETATRAHHRAIAAALPATARYGLYGATEAGVLFMECVEGRYHHNSEHSHIELVNLGDSLGRVVVTTLGRTWMPLVRYDLGDVVRVAKDGHCGCGLDSGGYLLERIEGRAAEALNLGGRTLTPAALDDLIDSSGPLDGWQLVHEEGHYTLRVLGGDGQAAARALSQLAGGAPNLVEARRETAILPEGSGKYRLVRSA